jgi:hypothetical protein
LRLIDKAANGKEDLMKTRNMMKEVEGIRILEDIELSQVVGGANKKSSTQKKTAARKKPAAVSASESGPELI